MPTLSVHLTSVNATYTTAAGDYSIDGGGGNETITTGAGNSLVYTGAGNSTITMGAGNSAVITGPGNQTITTGAGNSTVITQAGNSTITTGAGNNTVQAGNGANTITTGAGLSHITTGNGDDTITTGAGDAVVNSGTGSDTVTTAAGNDLVFYNVTGNAGTHSVFNGGTGIDTLNLVMTRAEWMSAAVQTDVANYLVFLAANKTATGEDSAAAYQFTAFGLTASMFEKLQITVDGVVLQDATNRTVVLHNDAISTTEKVASVALNVLANDAVPDLIKSFSFTNPAHGSVHLDAAYLDTASPPSAQFIYTPTTGFYDYLAVGETANDAFTYTVTDAAGGVSTATVKVTINGTNDAPVIGKAVLSGAVTEQATPTGVLTSNGTINFSDVDLSDVHTVTSAPAAGTLGILTAKVGTDDNHSTGLGGVITWNYVVDNAKVQYLAAGESKVETFTVTLDDGHGGLVPSTVNVKITGTNEAPVINTATSSFAGAVIEQIIPAGNLTSSGAINFSDVDLSDSHTVSAVAASSDTLGTLTAKVSTDDNHSTGLGGVITWNYVVDNAKVQYLAAGESKVETFTVTLDDGHGGLVPSTVSVKIIGTNEAPTIAASSPNPSNSSISLTAINSSTPQILFAENFNGTGLTGNLGFHQIDTDLPTSYMGTLPNWQTTAEGPHALHEVERSPGNVAVMIWQADTATQRTPVAANIRGQSYQVGFEIAPAGWTNGAPDQRSTAADKVQILVLNSSGTVIAHDEVGGGAMSAEATFKPYTFNYVGDGSGDVRLQIKSANPTDGHFAGAIDNISISTLPTVTGTGTINFGDVDLSDVHTVTSAPAAGTLGILTAKVGTDDNHSTGLGGVITWNYVVDNAKVQYLAAGESKVETFTVTLDDGHGGLVPSTVNVKITGTNEAPVINTATSSFAGAVIEQIIPAGNLTSSGAINFSDVDLSDSHTVSAVAASSDTLGTLTAKVSTDDNHSTGLGGVITWNYVVDNAKVQYLAAGESKVETFTVTLDDGHGGLVPSTVSVKIIGTNEAPVISNADLTGVIYPLYNNEKPFSLSGLIGLGGPSAPYVDSGYNFLFGSSGGHTEYTPKGKDSGLIQFTDVDLSDQHVVSTNSNQAEGNFGILKAYLTQDTTGSGSSGAVEWHYFLPDPKALLKVSASVPKFDSFNILIDDQHGGSITEVVNIKLIGATLDVPQPGFLENVANTVSHFFGF